METVDLGPPGQGTPQKRRISTSQGKTFALVSVLFMVIACALGVASLAGERNFRTSAKFDFEEYKALNASIIRNVWDHRHEHSMTLAAADGFAALSIFFLVPAAIVLNERFQRPDALLVPAFAATAGLLLVELMFDAGTELTANWIATWDIMNDDSHHHDGGFGPLQSLELSYMMAMSRGTWIFAVDALLLAFGIFSVATQTYRNPHVLSRRHAHLGLLCAFMGFLAFILELLRLVNWMQFQILAILVLMGLVLTTIVWTFWLAIQMGGIPEYDGFEIQGLTGRGAATIHGGNIGGSRVSNDRL